MSKTFKYEEYEEKDYDEEYEEMKRKQHKIEYEKRKNRHNRELKINEENE